jgi:undecaprenyl-diphosphatase
VLRTSAIRSNKQLTILRFVSFVFFLIMLFAFCFTGYIATHHQPLQFDTIIFLWLQSIRSSFMTSCVIVITFFGSRYFLFPCYTLLVIYYVFFRKKLWVGIAIALIGFLGNELLYLMQDVYQRIRPSNPLITGVTGYGYPSGHSLASFVFAGLMSFIIWQKHFQTKKKLTFTILLFFYATMIALSRSYLRVHYPSDVLGGFFLAMSWLIPCLWILYFVNKKYH